MPRKPIPTIYIVSDGRGETAHRVVLSAALQFEGQQYRVVRKAEVRTAEQVERSVAQAARARAAIFYTLVSEDTRRTMRHAAGRTQVPAVDVLGPAFTALHDLFGAERGATPGLLYDLERERAERMNAVEYTLKHDDGQRPHELGAADVVLVGVSRASKSSTCFFLAYQGVRAANVPLVPGVPILDALLAVPPEKVVGLRINANRLRSVREARLGRLGVTNGAYLDDPALAREVIEADRIMSDRGWRSIDVSYMAIEEIAREVMSLRGLEPRRV
jgi:hypothetical protein